MARRFFSSTQAALISGCTQRQLQYWREQGSLVPAVWLGGAGRSGAYSEADLGYLAVMYDLLSAGLDVRVAWRTVALLKQAGAFGAGGTPRYMFSPAMNGEEAQVRLMPFDSMEAREALERGEFVVPLWLDRVAGRVQERVRSFEEQEKAKQALPHAPRKPRGRTKSRDTSS